MIVPAQEQATASCFWTWFLNRNSEGSSENGKPGNGKSRLRRKTGLKEQGVLQGRAGAKCTGRAVWGVQCWASRRVQGRSASCWRSTASARSTESNIHNLSDIFMMEPVEVPSMKPDVANYRKHIV